jgi:hypothetical protein
MDRRMVGEHHRMAVPSAPAAARRAARFDGEARRGWRPDLALLVAVVGLVLGVLVMIPLVRAITPGPPSAFSQPAAPAPLVGARPAAPPVRGPSATYRSGGSVVARGVAYSALSAQRATNLTLPGSAGSLSGDLVIVKVLLQGVATASSTASVGLVDLIDGGVDYRPLLGVETALAHTRWQTLVLRQVASGSTKRVKLVFEVPNSVPVRLKLMIGSHATGAPRFAIPVGPAAG